MKRATAYHEAGHAVIGHVLSLPMEHATITDDDESLGRVRYRPLDLSPDDLEPDEHALRCHALATYAGPIAECGGAPDEWREQWGGDSDSLGEMILRLVRSDDDHLNLGPKLEAEAARLLESHWPAIKAVAGALLERQTLTHEELGSIIRDAPSAQRGD